MFLKLTNMKFTGNIDYKGLNIELFIAGSQVYDFLNGVFLVQTEENAKSKINDDLIEITKEEYESTKKSIELNVKPEKQIKQDNVITLQKQIDNLNIAIAQILGGAK